MKQTGIQIKTKEFDPAHIHKLINAGHIEAADKLLKKAEKKTRKNYDVLFLKGKVATEKKDTEAGKALFKKALSLAKTSNQREQSLFQIAKINYFEANHEEACKAIESFKEGNWADDKYTHFYLKALRDGKDEKRIQTILPKLTRHLDHIKIQARLYECLLKTKKIEQAKSLLHPHLETSEDPAATSKMLVNLEEVTGHFREALEVVERLPAHLREKEYAFREWIKLNDYLDPDDQWVEKLRNYVGDKHLPYAEWDLASMYFARGDFNRGAYHMEARHFTLKRETHGHYLIRRKIAEKGLPEDNKKILVSYEQGMGDQIRFSRYLHGLSKREENVISVVTSERLTPLFKRSFPRIHFFERTDLDRNELKEQGFNDEITLGSLSLFPTHKEKWPRTMNAPFLTPNEASVKEWQEKWGKRKLTIGCSWRSVVTNPERPLWYPPLQEFADLFNGVDCQLVSLQNDVTEEEVAAFAKAGHDIHITEIDCKDDIDGLSALCASVDVVVGVGTATSELSGAVGQKTMVLGNRHPERWYLSQVYLDAFYPDLRMYMSDTGAPWTPSLNAIKEELTQLAKDK